LPRPSLSALAANTLFGRPFRAILLCVWFPGPNAFGPGLFSIRPSGDEMRKLRGGALLATPLQTPTGTVEISPVKNLTSKFRASSAIARLRRFVERDLLPILIRPFEGAAEERPLAHGLTQIAGTLRTMGIQPDDSLVKQIGSEFEMLFCAAAAPGKLNARPQRSPIDPAKSISDLIRQPPRRSAAVAALQRFITFCNRRIITRMRRSFL
jgi:hypothetical protein